MDGRTSDPPVPHLRRHHAANLPVMNRGAPTSAEWHSLWPSLASIREDAAAGDVDCRDWLATHAGMINAVEVCRRHRQADAITYRGPGR